jgi:cation transport ATPase
METHEYYENLILNEESLTVDELERLDDHLTDCTSCQKLQEQWEGCLNLLHESPMISPAKGFSKRWETYFQNQVSEHEKKVQTRIIIGVIVMITLLSIFSSAILFSPQRLIQFTLFFSGLVAFFAGYINQLRAVLDVIRWPLLLIGLSGIGAAVAYIIGSVIYLRNHVKVRAEEVVSHE